MVSPDLRVSGREYRGMGNAFRTAETRARIFLSSQETVITRVNRKTPPRARSTRRDVFFPDFFPPFLFVGSGLRVILRMFREEEIQDFRGGTMKICATGRPELPAGRMMGWMVLSCLLAMGIVSGCTRQEGKPISEQSILALKVGKTTEKEVLRMLGPPEEKARLLGEDLWTYRHVVHRGIASVDTNIKILRVRFDEKGVVRSVEQKQRQYRSLF
jgi:outer membrane protein assembly factor BamE (lipoprotein component of BamABCDE complex)